MKSWSFFILFLFLSFQLYCQKSISAFKIEIPPVIDGKLDIIYSATADSANGFIQTEPDKGLPSIENTVVYFLYDEAFIYVAFKCFQDPTKIQAKIQSRDNLTKTDDVIAFTLDTYNDQQNSFGFWLNPLGTQCDFKITNDGKNTDVNWDTEWQSATSVTSWGWFAEARIPFSSLKYKRNTEEWGINFSRVIRYASETSFWSGEMSEDFRISQGGKLKGLKIPKGQGHLMLFPYATLRYEDSDYSGLDGEFKADAGGDVNYQINSNLTANLTYNPDFATVEADQEQINLTRYELSYPEKRIFFQEGNELFKTRIKTFYSRRIGDIDYGTKLTGKVGGYNMNFLNTRTLANDDLQEPAAFFTTARVKKDILKSSSVGLTFADKSWDGGYTRSLSADYTLNLGKTWYLTGQFVGSLPGNLKEHSAYFVRFARENNIYHYHIRYTSIGKNFRENVNQTGFIVDDDRQELDGDITYKWWVQSNAIKYLYFGTANNIFWNHEGTLRSWYLTNQAKLYLQNKFSLRLLYNNEFKLFQKKYFNNRFNIELGYNTDEWSSVSLGYTFGRNFDRDFQLLSGQAKTKLTEKLALEYSFDLLKFQPDTNNSSTFINVLSVYYNFTNDLWVKVFAQNNTSFNRVYVYGMFGWRFKPPFGAIYLVYTRDELKPLDVPEKLNSDIVYFKLTYPIVIK